MMKRANPKIRFCSLKEVKLSDRQNGPRASKSHKIKCLVRWIFAPLKNQTRMQIVEVKKSTPPSYLVLLIHFFKNNDYFLDLKQCLLIDSGIFTNLECHGCT